MKTVVNDGFKFWFLGTTPFGRVYHVYKEENGVQSESYFTVSKRHPSSYNKLNVLEENPLNLI